MTQGRTDAQTLAAITRPYRPGLQHPQRPRAADLVLPHRGGRLVHRHGADQPDADELRQYDARGLRSNINTGNNANAGVTSFGNGTATPLASAVDFINTIARANASTEPAKRIFARYQGANPAIDPLEPRFTQLQRDDEQGRLTTRDTRGPGGATYLSNFSVPAVYARRAMGGARLTPSRRR